MFAGGLTSARKRQTDKPVRTVKPCFYFNGENELGKASDSDGRLDRRMRIVADEREIFELEIVNIFDRTIELHLR
jgi:hypothetical protein